MSSETLKLYRKAHRVVSKAARKVTKADRSIVQKFMEDATRNDSRLEHFENSVRASAILGGRERAKTLSKNLNKIGEALKAFAEGKSVGRGMRKLLPAYINLWIKMAEGEHTLYQTHIEASKALRN